LREALNLMLETRCVRLRVEARDGATLGEIGVADIVAGADAA